jgi:hypothetical protein
MGDLEGALTHTRNVIKRDDDGSVSNGSGTCMIVEPFAQNELENNVNPVVSTFYAASTLIYSLAFNGRALGAQAGEKLMFFSLKEFDGFVKKLLKSDN